MVWDYDAAAQLMTRAGFGDPPERVDRLFKMGREQAVDFLVDYENITNTKFEKVIKRAFPLVKRQLKSPFLISGPGFWENWWLTRMFLTPRPLEEKMTLFWHSHFATESNAVGPLALHQNITLRENALARFDTLVLAIARDPGMIRYLNNDENFKDHPTQNWARELMELHTMGIADVVTDEENYSQADVEAVARAFTGWTFFPTSPPTFRLDESQHDFGAKSIFGLPAANLNGDDVIQIICQRPAAARFIAKKLFEFFVYKLTDSNEDKATIETFARVYMDRDHSIKELVRSILKSDLFLSDRARFALRKSPIDLIVGVMRRLGVQYQARETFRSAPAEGSARMGQRLFSPPNVAGWKPELWFNASSLIERFNFATSLATSRGIASSFAVDVTLTAEQLAAYADKSPEVTVDNLLRAMGPVPVNADTRTALVNYLTTQDGIPVNFKPNAATIDRKVRNLIALIMMLPESNLN